MANEFQIEGLNELVAALSDLPNATSKNVGRRALKAEAQPLADQAALLAPELTGALQEGVIVSARLLRGARTPGFQPQDVLMHIGPHADVTVKGLMQEIGTYKEPAQPYLTPVWDEHQGGLPERVGAHLWREVERAADRHARKTARLARG